MKKIISFSVWGSLPLYTVGAVRNADLAMKLYPGWTCVFYCFDSVPARIMDELRARPNVEIRKPNVQYDIADSRGMFNRFLPAADSDIERMICRDSDSRLSPREAYAVEEWCKSGADFHMMRDHPYHSIPIMGGMWGVVGGKLNNIEEAIASFNPTSAKNQDQHFLNSWVLNKIRSGELSYIQHDPIHAKIKFPEKSKRGKENNGVYFVGQQIEVDENENDIYPEMTEDIRLVNASKID